MSALPNLEYKVLKIPHNRQEFYSNFLRSFGWQVQSMQETVDSVTDRSFGTSSNIGGGSMSGTIHGVPGTDISHIHGSTQSHSWGTQMGMGVTRVHTVLTVTYTRDLTLPSRDRLAWLEQQCWPHVNAYFARVDASPSYDTNWTEWQSYAWFGHRGHNLMAAGTEALPPASAKFTSLKVAFGVTKGAASGLEFHMALDLDRRKGLWCQAAVYLVNDRGLHLKDADRAYADRLGRVAATTFLKPSYDGARFGDIELFLPYDQLHLTKSRATLGYYAAIIDISTDSQIARTNVREFSYHRRFLGSIEAAELGTGSLETFGGPPPGTPAGAPPITSPKAAAPGKASAPTPSDPAAPAPPSGKPAAPAETPSAPAGPKPSAPAKTPSASPGPKPAVARPTPTAAPPAKKEALSLPPLTPLREEEWTRRTMEGFGWTELTEDRRRYLEGQRAKTPAARQKALKAALTINPKEPAYWAAVAFDPKTGCYDIKVLEEGLRVAPGSWILEQALATAYFQTRQIEKARAIVEKLSASAAGPAERRGLLILRALLAEHDNDYVTAIRLHDEADELIADPETRKYLAGFHQKRLRELMKAERG